MKFKFDWGAGVVAIIIGMLLFIGTLVFIATRQHFDLVDDDYYQKAIAYQQQIEKIRNANALTQGIQIVQQSDFLEVVFPPQANKNTLEGSIYFYSPVDKSNDFKVDIKPDEDLKQIIPTGELKSGRYTLKVDWKSNGIGYYHESKINIK